MKLFFKRLLGGRRNEAISSMPSASRGFQSSIQGGSDNALRAQLVQVVMRDLLRRSGIPPTWIVCYPQAQNSRSRGPGIFIRLSVKHWDDRLIQHTFAFQKALLTDIVSFEPDAGAWLHGIAWQLEVAASCPCTELPHKDFWQADPALTPSSTASSTPAAERDEGNLTPPQRQTSSFVAPITTEAYPAGEPTYPPKKSMLDVNARQDLERLFALRDKEIAAQESRDLLPTGYENTEPAALTQN